jgi:hypothetical protein
MSDSEQVRAAVARGRAYELFGRLIIEGITAESERWIHFLPAVAEYLPMSPIEYARVCKEVPPYGTRFLFPGSIRIRSLTQLHGLLDNLEGAPIYPELPRDHLGVSLAYLARLSSLEASAIQKGEDYSIYVNAAVRFLDSYLLRWMPVYAVAVRGKGSRFMEGYGKAVLGLTRSHRFSCTEYPIKVPPNVIVPPPRKYDDVSVFLAQPCRSGFFFSAGEVAELRSQMGLKTAYGERPQLIDGLFADAEKAGKSKEVLTEVIRSLKKFDLGLSEMVGLGLDISVWRERIAGSIEALKMVARNS